MEKPIEILITLPFEEKIIEPLRNISPRLHVTVHKAKEAQEIPDELWQKVEVLYTNRVLPKPEQAPNLRWIQFHWAGVDHAIQEPILSKPGLIATNLSGAAVPQMAEHAVMMMLALGHHLPELFDLQRRAEWPSERWKRFNPMELNSSVVGIIGYGSIGREIARIVRVFGATVLATKRDVMHPEDNGYIRPGLGDPGGDLVRRLYPPQALRSMLKECDFVVVTVPLTPETRHMISTEELASMKPSAYLVDVSRGGVVDHTALIQALREQKIAGAALDVFPEEPLPSNHALWKLPNVILTPHISGFSLHYDQRAIELFAENLKRYLAGEPLYNPIDPKRGY
jgi:phosphoglycerate dehydrogenase-like enzyme